MSIKSTKRQVHGDKTFNAAVAPLAPIASSYIISGTDDTALDPAGGQTILLKGVGFKPGATIMLGLQAIGVVSYIDTNTLSFTSPALSAGTYSVYVTNTDYGTGILTPGIIYSTFPTWTTSEGTQGSYYETQAINNTFVATSDSDVTSYVLDFGTLPTGSTLSSSGVLTGTAPVDSGSTTYTFTLRATDDELQDSTRSFSLTINTDVVTWTSPADSASYSLIGNQAMANVTLSATSAAGYSVSYTANALPTGVTLSSDTISGTPTVTETVSTLLTATAATTNRSATRTISWTVTLGDTYWKNVSLLLSSSTPTSTFINDASLNNSQLTIAGDTKPNNFNPYTEGYYSFYAPTWSDYYSYVDNSAFGTGDFTVEWWGFATLSSTNWIVAGATSSNWQIVTYLDGFYWQENGGNLASMGFTVPKNQWVHFAVSRTGGYLNVYVNGTRLYNAVNSYNYSATGNRVIGQVGGGANGPVYMSNVRFIKGTGIYSGTSITVPTGPLTSVAGTVLLTCQSNRIIDNSPLNASITTAGSPQIQSANPFTTPTTVSYNTKYSTYFDGTGDYLSTPDNSVFDFTGDFTMEAWVYPTAYGTDNGIICQWTSGLNFIFKVVSGNRLYFAGYPGGTVVVQGTSTTVPLNQWNHVAVSRSGSTVRLFVNGTLDSTTGTMTGTMSGTDPVTIGSLGTTQYWNGSISNLRIVKGQALYTSNFTPSTSPLTAVSGTSLLTCQDATLVDNSTNAFTITSYNQAKPIAVSPFTMTTSNTTVTSLGSAYFDGTGDYLSLTNSPTFALSGDYTIEAWVYRTSSGTQRAIIDLRGGGYVNVLFYMNTDNKLVAFNSSTSWIVSSTIVPLNQWAHVALTRSGTSVKFFINGVIDGTATNSDVNVSSGPLYIGRQNGSTTNDWLGYIEDVRVIKGTALYTSNFLPPQAPLTAVSGTSLLTCQYNGGANNNVFVDQSSFNNIITRTGNTTLGTFSPYSQTGWSTYYNGTTDYQPLPTNAAFAIGTADFTVEAWVMPTGPNLVWSQIFAGVSYGSSSDWGLYASDSNTPLYPTFYFTGSGTPGNGATQTQGSQTLTGYTKLTIGQWNHIAVSRASGTARMFINGVQTGPSLNASTWSLANSLQKSIAGGFNGNTNTLFTGYISNLRVVSGTGLYSANFTSPASPLTPIAGTILLTNQNNRWIDNSPNNFAITTGGTPTVQAYSPFGGITSVPTSYSVYFDGTGDYLQLASNTAFNLGAGDFTLEMWVNLQTVTKQGQYFFYCTGYNPNMFLWDSGAIYLRTAETSGEIVTPTASGLTVNTWNHVACVRSGNTYSIFINGELLVSGNSTGVTNAPTELYFGKNLQGYISNFRLVKGQALYTANFTPSTTPLTTTSQGATASQVSLLTCQTATMIDNSTNYFTITASGDTKPRPFNPFGTTTPTNVSYTPAVNGGSMYFDGTGDYLTFTAQQMLTSDWTMEMWIYPLDVSTKRSILQYGTFILIIQAGTIQSWIGATGPTSTIPLVANTWQYVGAVRIGGTVKIFVNGILGTGVSMGNDTGTSGVVGYESGSSTPFYGYMSDAKVTKGVALYTSNFYPGASPTTPTKTIGTTTYSSSLLLNGTSGGIIDYHSTNNLETVGNTQLVSEDPYSGSYYSNYYNGSSVIQSLNTTSISALGTQDFTLEGWVFPTQAQGTQSSPFYIQGVTGSDILAIYLTATSVVGRIRDTASALLTTLTSSVNYSIGVWTHIAFTRSGSTLTLFMNGVSVATSTVAAHNLTLGTVNLLLGKSPTVFYTGFTSNFRLVYGQSLYNSTFAPPTSPLTAISGTQLLVNQNNKFVNNGSSAVTLTTSGSPIVKSINPFQNNTSKSLYFDGTGDSLKVIDNPNINFGVGDFTIEFWAYFNVVNAQMTLISKGWNSSAAYASYLIWMNSDATIRFLASSNGGAWDIANEKVFGTMTAGVWTHVAVTRSGTTFRAFVNGVINNSFTFTSASSLYNSAVQTLFIGDRTDGGTSMNGYLKDMRITKGVARYTSTFTPPTSPYETK